MTEWQTQIPLGGLPVSLVLVWNRQQGGVVFVKTREITKTVFDVTEDGQFINAMFEPDDFTIFSAGADEVLNYNTIYDYKSIPGMLKWLKAQNLQKPELVFG